MRKQEITHHLNQIQLDLAITKDRLPKASRNAWRLIGRGYPTGGDGQPGAPGPSNPTERLALQGPDPIERDAKESDKRLKRARADIEWLMKFSFRYTIKPERIPDATLIDCVNPNCDHWMTGYGDDRPKNGRCERCYKFQRRHGREWQPKQEDVAS